MCEQFIGVGVDWQIRQIAVAIQRVVDVVGESNLLISMSNNQIHTLSRSSTEWKD